jgi:hypothetical protein
VTYGYSLSLDLTWTPDADLLASARSLGGQTTHGLWSIPVRAGADANVDAYVSLPYPDYPAFSPDGSQLALRSGYRAVLVDLTEDEMRFFEGAEGNMPLIWSPAAFVGEDGCSPLSQ